MLVRWVGGMDGKTNFISCPKKDNIYTVGEIFNVEDGVVFISFDEIPLCQNGQNQVWDEKHFEKFQQHEEKVRYVVVEVDKQVKEKRRELIFEN